MGFLTNKTILLISPQAWDTMFLSKHHYAVELAKKGNIVYFLCPLDEYKKGDVKKINIRPSGLTDNLFIIEHRLFFPFQLKFHGLFLFHWLMKLQLRRIIKKINRPLDIVWSFDLGNFFPLHFFDKKIFKIFHPVDEPLNKEAIESARGANILSVTKEILEKYKTFNIPKYFINHGVADEFFIPGRSKKQLHNDQLHVGFSGNLRRNDIDREVFLQIIKDNRGIIFDCWGTYSVNKAEAGVSADDATVTFIRALEQQPNVLLHGAIAPHQLAKKLREVDAFLICYDVNKDQSKGTNYHKVMEFLSMGNVIISNNISTYKDAPTLIRMVTERESNESLPALFRKVTGDLSWYNAPSFREKRIAFARANTYRKQIRRIEDILSGLSGPEKNTILKTNKRVISFEEQHGIDLGY